MADHSVQLLETTERSFTLKTGEFCLICRLRIWPDPALLAKFEPELDMLRARAANVRPAERICP